MGGANLSFLGLGGPRATPMRSVGASLSLFRKKKEGGPSLLTPDRAPSSPSLETDRATERRREEGGDSPSRMPIEARVERGREKRNPETTPVDGYLGSREDEERSETRYVMRIAGTSEPSNLRTHLALPAPPGARPSERRPKTRRPPHPSPSRGRTGDRPGPVAASPRAERRRPKSRRPKPSGPASDPFPRRPGRIRFEARAPSSSPPAKGGGRKARQSRRDERRAQASRSAPRPRRQHGLPPFLRTEGLRGKRVETQKGSLQQTGMERR